MNSTYLHFILESRSSSTKSLYLFLFIFGCAEFLFLHRLFSSCGKWVLFASCGSPASHCSGFSYGVQTLECEDFGSHSSQALEHRLSSCAHGLSCSMAYGIFLDPWYEFNPRDSISSVQSPRCVWLFVTPLTTVGQASLSITNSWSLLKLMSIESVMPSSHLILCHPLLLLPSIFPSSQVFSSESALRMKWPKYWSFSFSISPSNEHPGLISFRMDWLDLLAVRGTHKSLLQHHSSKASILRRSAFFTVQLSHPYMTTGKSIALTRWTFVGKVTFLRFNILSRMVITFLPRSKRLLISWRSHRLQWF